MKKKNEPFFGDEHPPPLPLLVPAPPACLVASWRVSWHHTSCVVMAWACCRVLTLMPSSLSCGRAVALVMTAMVVSRGLGYLCYALDGPSMSKYGLWVMKKILSMYLIVIFSKNLTLLPLLAIFVWQFATKALRTVMTNTKIETQYQNQYQQDPRKYLLIFDPVPDKNLGRPQEV